jgi:hypothetical protein
MQTANGLVKPGGLSGCIVLHMSGYCFNFANRIMGVVMLCAVVFAAGCSGSISQIPVRRLIPVAIRYDQASDELSVDVKIVEGVENPIYPGSIGIYTMIDGVRFEGLYPPRGLTLESKKWNDLWSPPGVVRYSSGEWKVVRVGIWSFRSAHVLPGEPVHVVIQKRHDEPKPKYGVSVSGTSYRID